MFALPAFCMTTTAVGAEQSPQLNLAAISRELSDHPDLWVAIDLNEGHCWVDQSVLLSP